RSKRDWSSDVCSSDLGTSTTHRGTAEIQAESVAYVVAGMLGLDTSSYSTGYVAQWASTAAQSQEREEILAVVQQSANAVKNGVELIMGGIEAVDSNTASTEATLATAA